MKKASPKSPPAEDMNEITAEDAKRLRDLLERYVTLVTNAKAEAEEKPGSEIHVELRKDAWTANPTGRSTRLLMFFTFRLLWDWVFCSTRCQPLVANLVATVSRVVGMLKDDVERWPRFYSGIARHFLYWPVLMSGRESEKDWRSAATFAREKLHLGEDHPRRNMRELGGDYGADVMAQFEILFFLRAGKDLEGFGLTTQIVSAARNLPELTSHSVAWGKWYEVGLQLFYLEYGAEFIDNPKFGPAVKHMREAGESRGRQKDMIRRKLKSQWETLASYDPMGVGSASAN